jgi:hypothetical protein
MRPGLCSGAFLLGPEAAGQGNGELILSNNSPSRRRRIADSRLQSHRSNRWLSPSHPIYLSLTHALSLSTALLLISFAACRHCHRQALQHRSIKKKLPRTVLMCDSARISLLHAGILLSTTKPVHPYAQIRGTSEATRHHPTT